MAGWAILALTAVLTGCATIRLAYNNAPELAYFMLDRQFDFNEEQAEVVKAELRNVQAWHRSTELPEIAKLLQRTQGLMQRNATSSEVCGLFADMRPRFQSVVDRAVPGMAQVALQATAVQLAAWQKTYDKRNAQFRADYIEAKPEARTAKRLASAQKNYERVYGSLTSEQLRLLRDSYDRASWDPRVSLTEMQRRQQEGLLMVRGILADKLSLEGAKSRILAFNARISQSPDATYNANSTRWQRETCDTAAAIHNAATTDQRAKALATLKDYEADLRALMR